MKKLDMRLDSGKIKIHRRSNGAYSFKIIKNKDFSNNIQRMGITMTLEEIASLGFELVDIAEKDRYLF